MKMSKNSKKGRGLLMGLVYGLVPHTFCILFIVFTVVGVTAATSLFKPLLLNPYFFYILIALSMVFATISAFFYFKKQGFITLGSNKGAIEISFLPGGFRRKWKYLLTLYGTTIFINLLLFMVIFPIAANLGSGSSFTASLLGAFGGGAELQLSDSGVLMTLRVDIPCPGHAPLIIGELKQIEGMEGVKFKFPNLFDVGYNPEKTSKEQILSLDVFGTYKATVVNEEKGLVNIQPINNTEQLQPTGGAGGGCGGGCGGGSDGGGCGCGSGSCGR